MESRSRKSIEYDRWNNFVDFRRRVDLPNVEGVRGNKRITVMKATGQVHDVLPGNYRYKSVFQFDSLDIKPRYTEIVGVQWIPNDTMDSQ